MDLLCQRCNSPRLSSIFAKSSDRNHGNIEGCEFDGYLPVGLEISSGNFIDFEWCRNCGQIQGEFPAKKLKGVSDDW